MCTHVAGRPVRLVVTRLGRRYCDATSVPDMATTLPNPIGGRSRANGDRLARPSARFWTLTFGSVGVVYGDIGTSPLYAFREAARAAAAGGAAGDSRDPRRALADLLVADRRRHAQIRPDPDARRQSRRGRHPRADGARPTRRPQAPVAVILIGIVAAALFYGDAVITPALSVLSAVEGPRSRRPGIRRLSCFRYPWSILVGLFVAQSPRHGSASPLSSDRLPWSGSS